MAGDGVAGGGVAGLGGFGVGFGEGDEGGAASANGAGKMPRGTASAKAASAMKRIVFISNESFTPSAARVPKKRPRIFCNQPTVARR